MKRSKRRREQNFRSGRAELFKNVIGGVNMGAAIMVMAVVLLAPFPLASVEWRWISIWALLLGIATPFLDYSHLTRTHVRCLSLILAASGLLGIFIVLQATGFGGILPEHRLFTETRALLGRPLIGYPSAVPTQSLLVAGGFALALLTFSTSFVVGSNPKLARIFLIAIAIMGTANGALGVYLYYSDPYQLLWARFDVPKGQPSGTFVSRNHAVTLFASCTVIFFTIVMRGLLASIPRGRMSLKSRIMIMMLNNPPRIGTASILFILCLSLTFATGSRGGLLALLCGLFTAYLLIVLRVFGAKLGAILAGGGALLGFAFLSQVGLGAIGERFAEMRLNEDGRAEIYKAIARMIGDSPWIGFGTGSFELVLPQYRPDTITPRLIWDYAHSGPLQLIVELGIPAAVLGLGILMGIIGLCIWGSLKRRRDQDLAVIGASVGMVGFIHSFVDFSLQIPGFMIVYAAVLGAAAAQAFPTRQGGEATPVHSARVAPVERL